MHLAAGMFVKKYDPTQKPETSEVRNQLERHVRSLAFERCFYEGNMSRGNHLAHDAIKSFLIPYCQFVRTVNPARNIEVGWSDKPAQLVIGAHYDSPHSSPGADDNASSVAVLMELVKSLAEIKPEGVRIVFFNGEEDELTGSTQYVSTLKDQPEAIILEMVGYYSSEPGSQTAPAIFPQFSVGDFLAVIANNKSKKLLRKVFSGAKSCGYRVPLRGLTIPWGLETLDELKDVMRSDHSPFWNAGLPALMLTDTANFRNHNYHKHTDRPDTLNYCYMAELVRLLKEVVLKSTEGKKHERGTTGQGSSRGD